jgi:hypothetical protein
VAGFLADILAYFLTDTDTGDRVQRGDQVQRGGGVQQDGGDQRDGGVHRGGRGQRLDVLQLQRLDGGGFFGDMILP